MRPLHVLGMPLPLVATGSASAAGDGVDVSRGAWACADVVHAMSRGWSGASSSALRRVPSFVAVARQPSTPGPALHAFLTTPHGDMRDVRLTCGLTGDPSREGPGNLETCFNESG
jgi:hypothetical protein